VQLDAGMAAQPGLYLGVLVGGVVVQDHMQPPPRVGLGDELEEVQELAVAVPWLAGVGDRAGGHLQRREQRGRAVPEVVVGAPLGPARPYRADRLGPLQRLDLGLLVHPDHDRMRRRVQIQPDHVPDPGSSSGSVENLNVSVCQGLRSCSAHTRATVLWLTPSSAASSREDQWVTPGGWGGGLRVVARISARRSRRTVWGRPARGRSASWSVSPSRA
jgi:hypothetical protein